MKLYRSCVTQSQLQSIRDLNARSVRTTPPVLFGGADVVDIVDDGAPAADMLTGIWFGIVIGVMPDGSRHS